MNMNNIELYLDKDPNINFSILKIRKIKF